MPSVLLRVLNSVCIICYGIVCMIYDSRIKTDDRSTCFCQRFLGFSDSLQVAIANRKKIYRGIPAFDYFHCQKLYKNVIFDKYFKFKVRNSQWYFFVD